MSNLSRRNLMGVGVAALVASMIPATAYAKGLTSLLADASDNSLNKLGEKDGFYRDLAVRILLPGSKGKLARSLLKTGDKLGLTSKLTRSLNDAASLAANEAKPIFRDAINGLKLRDVPNILTQNDGGTQYLKTSAGSALQSKVQPLVVAALGKVGAFNQLDNLAKQKGVLGQFVKIAKLDNQSLSDSVTEQALKGIYSYMGSEEGQLRKKIGNVGDILKDIF
jgi:hypothetical protein